MADPARRLNDAIAAVCPIDGVSVGVPGDGATVRIFFAAGATANQRTAAAAALAGFDWSQAAQDAWELAVRRATAEAFVPDADRAAHVLRSLVKLLVDENNTLRTWLRDFKTQAAAATTLADFKTRVATLPTLADRTPAQARTAIIAAIQAGTADE